MTFSDWLPAGGLLVLLLLGAAAATADDEGGRGGGGFYGAIAYSPSTRSHGWAYDYPTRHEAEKRALARCERFASDCIVPVWFHEACGALAVGTEGYGTGWAASRKQAEAYALQSCRGFSSGCTVVRWVCTSK